MRHFFQTAQWVPYPVTTVFAFFADPANLPRLMPAWQKAKVVRASIIPPPGTDLDKPRSRQMAAGAGSAITIAFRPFPLSPVQLTWDARIVEFEWDDHFCDQQASGPFAYWRHCHRVSDQPRQSLAGTTIVDDLAYELPLGMLSEPAHALFVRRQIKRIFEYRQQQLLKLLA